MGDHKRRVNKLEQLAGTEGEKRRLVLYYKPPDRYCTLGLEYTEDDLPRVREQYDLMIIREVRPSDEPKKQSQ
jgi:hypothetical protein